MFKIAVLISGDGSNLQSIIDAVKTKYLNCQISQIIGDRKCLGLVRGDNEGIRNCWIERKSENFCQELDAQLDPDTDLIVLAGFLSILNAEFTNKWQKKIINIHPSLLPKYGGKGMYGMKVHHAVIDAGEKQSGCTTHYVDQGIDSGEIIMQRIVDINPDETADTLSHKVLVEEHKLMIETIKHLINQK